MSLTYVCADATQRTEGLTAADLAVKRGQLIVLPTDTVYGVGADAFSPAAVAALLQAKGRGRDMPPPVLVGSEGALDGLVFHPSQQIRDLTAAFWPGALTVIAEHAPSLAWDLGDTRGTVAIRMPQHALALDLLNQTGPLAVSSANRTGQPAATTAGEAQRQLGDDIEVYLDGGETGDSVPSTIVDLTGERPVVLRAGAISADELRRVIPDLVTS